MPKLHSTRSNSAFTLLLLGAGALSMACGAAVGCSSDPQPLPVDTSGSAGEGSGGGGGGGGDDGSAAATKAEALFREVEPLLMANCSAPACHGGESDVNFLGGEDPYDTIQKWRGIVQKDWHNSKILVHPTATGGHAGTNIDSPSLVETLKPGLEAWLEEEAKTILDDKDGDVPAGPGIEPVTPVIGFNALYLKSISPDFEGMAITFTADELTPNLLQLTEVQIHASSVMGVHVVHPLFVVYPKGVDPDPDPVDSCSNVDQSIDVGQTATLGPGTVVLSNWKPGARLGVVFEKIEKYQAGGPVDDGGCKDVAAFTANAQGPLQNNCVNCHGGNNAAATAAVSMEDLQADPAKACAQVKNRVDLGNAAGSQIFVVTEPGSGANHPFKFNGNAGNFNNFRTAVSVWITAEADAAAAGQ